MSEEIAVTNTGTVVTDRSIENMIYTVRGIQIIMDQDLAKLYGVDTKRLNEQVKRNKSRFPGDFMFRLTTEEFRILKSQNATSSWGGRRYAPIGIKPFNKAHDRFLIIDEKVYHIGASLKDIGKRWFAFSLMNDISPLDLKNKI